MTWWCRPPTPQRVCFIYQKVGFFLNEENLGCYHNCKILRFRRIKKSQLVIILPMANPDPEITPQDIQAVRSDGIIKDLWDVTCKEPVLLCSKQNFLLKILSNNVTNHFHKNVWKFGKKFFFQIVLEYLVEWALNFRKKNSKKVEGLTKNELDWGEDWLEGVGNLMM